MSYVLHALDKHKSYNNLKILQMLS